MRPEELLTKEATNFLKLEYYDVIFRVDIAADIPLPPHLKSRNKKLHGRWSTGYPDIFIAKCMHGFGGLYIELKATKTVPKSKHTDRQKIIHQHLRKSGYKVHFACGIDEFKQIVKKYLSVDKQSL